MTDRPSVRRKTRLEVDRWPDVSAGSIDALVVTVGRENNRSTPLLAIFEKWGAGPLTMERS